MAQAIVSRSLERKEDIIGKARLEKKCEKAQRVE